MLLLLLMVRSAMPTPYTFFALGPACTYPGCMAHGVPLQNVQAVSVPDELEMRAAAFGVPIGQAGRAPTNLEQFEKLVDRQEAVLTATATPISPLNEEDNSELLIGLRSQSERRRAPAILLSKRDEEGTTSPAEEALDQLLPTTPLPETNSKCNSQMLRKLMLENMNDNSSESKRKINMAAEAKFGGNVDVICSRGHFSYVFSSNLYCEASKNLVTCIAFRQTTSSQRAQ